MQCWPVEIFQCLPDHCLPAETQITNDFASAWLDVTCLAIELYRDLMHQPAQQQIHNVAFFRCADEIG